MACLIMGFLVGIFLGAVGMLVFCAWVMDSGCEFCDNGDHLTLRNKYGDGVHCRYCPICGRRVD